ncbi:MAG TPA: sulfotransferase [Sphingomicrobium sp.]|nr:sulfotransferase [Sphingomicrobium sp.]
MLKQPFLKLPIRFDSEALAAEVRGLPAEAWTPHPTGYVGNEAVRLITPFGEPTDDIEGPMAPTEWLGRCSYIQQIMASIGAVWGRSRLMGLAPGSEVPSHVDINYYWRTHLRIHIPVITNPGVLFTCGDRTEHMAAGDCWIFDSFRWHDVQNKGSEQRIHLVIDTVGGGLLPELMSEAELCNGEPRFIRPDTKRLDGLLFENVNSPKVMSPWEMRCHLAFVREQSGSKADVIRVLERVERFVDSWVAAWARFGDKDEGMPVYSQLLQKVRADCVALDADRLQLPNELVLGRVLEELIFVMAIGRPIAGGVQISGATLQARGREETAFRDRFERPIFIVSTPRSGSSLLYETLEQAPDLFSIGDESHWIIEEIPGLAPHQRSWSSNRLTADDARGEIPEKLAESFYRHLTNRESRVPRGPVRMLEKTPKNALRVPFIDAIWPDSQFIYLYRDVRQAFYSMWEAWRSGGFITYPQLPGWRGAPWSLLLVPGWQRLNGMQIPATVAHQWAITTETMLDDLEKIDPSRVEVIDYSTFLGAPQTEIERIAKRLGLSWDRSLGATLPPSKTMVSPPDPDKWRRIAQVVEGVWPIVEKADRRAREFLKSRGIEVAGADQLDPVPPHSASL